MSKPLKPFDNENESITLDGLTVENRIDQLEIYGSLSITRDQPGLERALMLKQLIDAAVEALQNDAALPDRITLQPTDSVDNPFK